MDKDKISSLSAFFNLVEKGGGDSDVNGLEGFSGKKIISSLRGLTKIFCGNSNVYLEIGVYRGLTLLANAHKNESIPCFGIDNFSLFDTEGENRSIIKKHIVRLSISNAHVIDADYEEALDAFEDHVGEKKVGVFFVDGAHDYRSQLVPLLRIVPYLSNDAVIIVDDANYPHVRQATNDFLKTHTDFALFLEAYTKKHPANMTDTEKNEALEGWWNGINIMVKDPLKLVPRNFVKEQNKDLYFASHNIFRHRLAGIAFDILKFADGLSDSDADEDVVVQKLRTYINNYKQKNTQLFLHQNTYSDELPNFKLYNF